MYIIFNVVQNNDCCRIVFVSAASGAASEERAWGVLPPKLPQNVLKR